MADIFVSYASGDRDRIEPLIQLLEDQGWSVWWDRELIAGPSFTERIQEKLETAKCVVVVWSHNSIRSHWCRDEANEGLKRQCLVPLRIDDISPPLGFRSLQTACLLDWPEESGESERLIAGIRDCLGSLNEVLNQPLRASAPMSRERSLAVLPFKNLSPDPEQEYFCDGLVDDITTELSRIPQFMVISRNSSFAYKGSSAGVRDVAQDLAVNFVLHGSVRRSGDRARVSVMLVEAASGKTIWAKKYDRDIVDSFALQDELTAEIVTALDVELISGETGRLTRTRYRSAEAGEVLYKGMFEYHKFERSAGRVAREYFEEFVRLEPESVLGYVWLAKLWTLVFILGWEPPETATQQLRKCVDRSLSIDANDPDALVADAYHKVLMGDLEGGCARQTEPSAIRRTSMKPGSHAAGY